MFFPARRVAHQSGLPKLREMAGDAGLPHAQHFLDLDDGELLFLQQKEQAQTRFVGEEAQGFYD